MRVTKKDFFAIVVVALIAVALIIAGTGHEKAKVVPPDDTHRPFYEAMAKGAGRMKPRRAALRATTRRPTLCLRNIRQKNNV